MYPICVILSLPFQVWWWSFLYTACQTRGTLMLLLSKMCAAFYLYVHVRILIYSVWIGCMSEVDRWFKHSICRFQLKIFILVCVAVHVPRCMCIVQRIAPWLHCFLSTFLCLDSGPDLHGCALPAELSPQLWTPGLCSATLFLWVC